MGSQSYFHTGTCPQLGQGSLSALPAVWPRLLFAAKAQAPLKAEEGLIMHMVQETLSFLLTLPTNSVGNLFVFFSLI